MKEKMSFHHDDSSHFSTCVLQKANTIVRIRPGQVNSEAAWSKMQLVP